MKKKMGAKRTRSLIIYIQRGVYNPCLPPWGAGGWKDIKGPEEGKGRKKGSGREMGRENKREKKDKRKVEGKRVKKERWKMKGKGEE